MSIETEYDGAAANDEVMDTIAATLTPSDLAGNRPQPWIVDQRRTGTPAGQEQVTEFGCLRGV